MENVITIIVIAKIVVSADMHEKIVLVVRIVFKIAFTQLRKITMTNHDQLSITKYDLLYEQRMTRVETTFENMDKHMREGFKEIKTDLRWLAIIMLGHFGTLFGLMAHGFKWF